MCGKKQTKMYFFITTGYFNIAIIIYPW